MIDLMNEYKDKSIQIRLELKEDVDKHKLIFLHQTVGSKFWAETLRHCINLAYNMYSTKSKNLFRKK